MRSRGTRLIAATDPDFAWMLGAGPPRASGPRLPSGSVDDAATLAIVRAGAARMRAEGTPGSWMMVAEVEVVGLCGFERAWSAGRVAEIGCGVASGRRRRGHATRALAAPSDVARGLGVRALVAETEAGNVGSERVLETCGFRPTAARDDGAARLTVWRHALET